MRDKNKLRDISFPLLVRGDIIYRRGWISRVTNSLSHRCAVVSFSTPVGANQWTSGLKSNVCPVEIFLIFHQSFSK